MSDEADPRVVKEDSGDPFQYRRDPKKAEHERQLELDLLEKELELQEKARREAESRRHAEIRQQEKTRRGDWRRAERESREVELRSDEPEVSQVLEELKKNLENISGA